MAPSIINDVMNISPEKLFPILAGKEVDGGGIIPCKEDFTIKDKTQKKQTIFLLFLCIIFFILLKYASVI